MLRFAYASATVVVAALLFYRVHRRVQAHVVLRRRILAGEGDAFAFEGRTLTRFDADANLVGQQFAAGQNKSVDKLLARAASGGGFVRWQWRAGNELVEYLFFVQPATKKGVVGRGLPL